MCGFAGFVCKREVNPSEFISVLKRMGKALIHRGPDELGEHVGRGFSVIHRRLSIIDIAGGKQPMISSDGRVGIAYNGEIYNYKELKSELKSKGVIFYTNSDTEVFLSLFETEGVNCFNRLEGMFTAFIWDYRKDPEGDFFLVRDQLGIKPLYLYEDPKKFSFSSELRPFLRQPEFDMEIDPIGVGSYFTYRYCQAPYTFFKNIRRIEAGNYVRIRHGRASVWRYWDIPVDHNFCDISMNEAAEHLRKLLRDSVERQLMSEVPVGILLSGGLDSSVIASLCSDVGAKLLSFNIGFKNLNEFEFSNEVAQKFDLPHIVLETTPEDIANRFERVVNDMDEPIADPACFPLHVLCDKIKQHVTVVLSGEGSDELLGGYPQYQRLLNDPPSTVWEKFERFLEYSWYFNKRPSPTNVCIPEYLHWRHRQYFTEQSTLNGMLSYDMKTWLPENLMAKADKILMSHSLEGRFPFLSTKIVEFCMSLPESYKIYKNNDKIILRSAFDSKLPISILNRPKMGFSVPVDDLLIKMHDQLNDLINSNSKTSLCELINFKSIRQDFNDFFSGRQDNALWLWTMFVFLQWFK